MKQRLLTILFFVLLLSSVGIPLFSGRASAQSVSATINQPPDLDHATYTWLNQSVIIATIGTQKLEFDFNNQVSRGGGRKERYFYPAGYQCTDNAHNRIFVNITNGVIGQTGINLQYNPPNTTGNCTTQFTNNNLNIGNLGNSTIEYLLSNDKTTITSLDGKVTFIQNTGAGPNGDVYVKNGDSSACPDIMVTNSTQTSYTVYSTTASGNPVTVPGATVAPSCKYKVSFTGNLGTQANNSGTTPTTGGTPPGGGGSTTKVNCTWSLNPITWFLCPVLDLVQSIMNQVGKWIFDFLKVPNCDFQVNTTAPNCASTARALYNAWSSMRDIALVVLAITALIMILSQALSFGPFDAYTIKKVLPRMVVAAILITLSWSIVGLMVAISNAMGDGVRALISGAFGGLANPTLSGGTLTAGTVGGIGVGLSLGILGVLSLGLTAALALLVGFFVIILRSILVLFLAILAPVAIVCYILPGTNKAWDFWWDSFSGVLLMFPIIAGIIAIGAAFAKITAAASNSTVNQIVAFIAIYAPFFLLPVAIRLAGGAISSLGGVINDRGRGAFDRLKKFRGNETAKNMQALKEGKRFQGRRIGIPGTGVGFNTDRAVGRFNRISRGAGTGFKGSFGLGDRGYQAMSQAATGAAGELMKTKEFQNISQNDSALRAATYSSYDRAVAGLQRDFDMDAYNAQAGARAAQTSIGFNEPGAIAAAEQLINTGTGYDNLHQLTSTIARVSGRNVSTISSLSGFANSQTKRVGRFDLAPSYVELQKLALGESGVRPAPTADDYKDIRDKNWNSASLQEIVAGKPKAMTDFANHFEERLRTGKAEERRSAAIALLEMQKSLPYANAANQEIINHTMNNLRDDAHNRLGLNFDSHTPVEQQLAAIARASHPGGAPGAVDLNGKPLTGETLIGMARTYDSGGTPFADRNRPQGGGGEPAET